MSSTQATATEQTGENDTEGDRQLLLELSPTTKPTLLRLAVVLIAGSSLYGYFRTNPTLLGSQDITNTASLIILLAATLVSVRFFIDIFILIRTTYRISPEAVEQRYTLFFRTTSKAVRFDKLRSQELTQNRAQKLLNCGSITLNRGLGELTLNNVESPKEVYNRIQFCADARESE